MANGVTASSSSDSPTPALGAHLPLSDPLALVALASIPGITPSLIASLVKAFPTYASLAAASPSERATRARSQAAASLPEDLPPISPLNVPPGVSVLSPAAPRFPGVLRPYPTVAPVLFHQGSPLTPRNALGVLGDSHPTPTARAAARVAVRSATAYGLPVVVVLNARLGELTAAYAVSVGATVWGVLSSGHLYAPNFQLLSDICASGGAVVSTSYWLHPDSHPYRIQAERLATVLSAAVLCTSDPVPGLPSDSSASLLAAEYGRPRIAPRPEDPEPVRVSDLGLKMCTDSRFAASKHRQVEVVCSDPADLDYAVKELALTGSPASARRPYPTSPAPPRIRGA